MNLLARMYEQLSFGALVAIAICVGLIVLLVACEMYARRREDQDEMAPYQPMTDRRPDEEPLPVVIGGPPDVEPAAPRARTQRQRAKRSNKRKARHK